MVTKRPSYRIRSKSTGSFSGNYDTEAEADAAAEEANEKRKNGHDDWEPRRKVTSSSQYAELASIIANALVMARKMRETADEDEQFWLKNVWLRLNDALEQIPE